MLRTFQGFHPRLGQEVYIDPSAQVIGDVHIGDHSSVWPQTVIRGDVHSIRIGERTNIQDASVLHVTRNQFALHLGNDVSIAHRVVLHGCTIEDHVLVGIGAVVMDGAVLREYSFVAAGSLVPPGMEVPSRSLAMGTPAKIVRELRPREIEMIQHTAAGYVELARVYRETES